MGLTLTGAFRCGACGKPRGLTHVCAPGKRRRRRHALMSPVAWECGRCGQPRGLQHTCSNRGDFKARRRKAATADRRRKRKAAAERRAARRRQAAADRRARARARKAAAKKARASRPRARSGDSHEPGTCNNRDCPKYGCRAYWAGMADCPGPHEGD
jgi:hypothetical protein